MPTCLNCNTKVSHRADYCCNCGAPLSSPAIPASSQPKLVSYGLPGSPKASESVALSARLERAMRRAELLGYAAAGLGIAILFAIIGIAFV